MKITTISPKGLNLIKECEGLRLKPYLCSASVATIGIGTTVYPDGRKVSMHDPAITEAQALEFLAHDLQYFCKQVDAYTTDAVNQHQFDSLTSFAYNCGVGNLKASTLLKKVNMNPGDVTIRDEFMKWSKAAGKVVKGLQIRRQKEADLYFN